tara:strand:+ start:759 stop:1070 length:312 start_codon:yes stop_codon:yes gene_type:complete
MGYKMKGFSQHAGTSPAKQTKQSQEQKEDAAGVTTNIKTPKAMKDGPKNRTHIGLWYKINGKAVTKAQYLAYKNKPGGDEPGKQTNDANVSLAKESGKKRIKK